jgi:hypothetical protein
MSAALRLQDGQDNCRHVFNGSPAHADTPLFNLKSKNHPAGLDEPGWTMSLPKDVLTGLKQVRYN